FRIARIAHREALTSGARARIVLRAANVRANEQPIVLRRSRREAHGTAPELDVSRIARLEGNAPRIVRRHGEARIFLQRRIEEATSGRQIELIERVQSSFIESVCHGGSRGDRGEGAAGRIQAEIARDARRDTVEEREAVGAQDLVAASDEAVREIDAPELQAKLSI